MRTGKEQWKLNRLGKVILPSLGVEIYDPCFAEEYVEKYQQGKIQATNNIYEANLNECHLKQLEPFAVKASLVVPVSKQKN